MTDKTPKSVDGGERIAKVIARAGLGSRREIEAWIEEGRIKLNGKKLDTPAVTVTAKDKIEVDGQPLPERERTRLFLYHKPRGLVTTTHDPEGRPTVFEALPEDMPRVVSVGRLDINTEGLLLLTNDGGLARVLELPSTGWLRRYRVRAFGTIDPKLPELLANGIVVEGVAYGPIEATIDGVQGGNAWLTLGLREGKNREVKRVLAHLGLTVNRLIRISFGPFQLMDVPEGEILEVRAKVLRDQLGRKLMVEAQVDLDAPIINHLHRDPEPEAAKKPTAAAPSKTTGRGPGRDLSAKEGRAAIAAQKAGRPMRSEGSIGRRPEGEGGGYRSEGRIGRKPAEGWKSEGAMARPPRSGGRIERPEDAGDGRPARGGSRPWTKDFARPGGAGRGEERGERGGGFSAGGRGDGPGGERGRAPAGAGRERSDRVFGAGGGRGFKPRDEEGFRSGRGPRPDAATGAGDGGERSGRGGYKSEGFRGKPAGGFGAKPRGERGAAGDGAGRGDGPAGGGRWRSEGFKGAPGGDKPRGPGNFQAGGPRKPGGGGRGPAGGAGGGFGGRGGSGGPGGGGRGGHDGPKAGPRGGGRGRG